MRDSARIRRLAEACSNRAVRGEPGAISLAIPVSEFFNGICVSPILGMEDGLMSRSLAWLLVPTLFGGIPTATNAQDRPEAATDEPSNAIAERYWQIVRKRP